MLIVGGYFDSLGDETRRFINKGWHMALGKPVEIRDRIP